MTPERKQEILEKIRQDHKIAVDENDPLFAIVTANEEVFNDLTKKTNIMFVEHLANLESFTENYLTKIKELTETKISNAVADVYQNLEEYKMQIDKREEREIPKTQTLQQSIPTIYWIALIMSFAIGYSLALIIL